MKRKDSHSIIPAQPGWFTVVSSTDGLSAEVADEIIAWMIGVEPVVDIDKPATVVWALEVWAVTAHGIEADQEVYQSPSGKVVVPLDATYDSMDDYLKSLGG